MAVLFSVSELAFGSLGYPLDVVLPVSKIRGRLAIEALMR